MDREIAAGYKQTETGVIPEDWELFSIEELTPKNKQYNIVDGPFGSNLKTIHYRKKGIPIITSGYVTDGKFYAVDYLYVDLEKFKQEKRSAVRGGDIVMAKIGERCGASAILPKNHLVGILSGNALKITIDNKRFVTELVAQILWQHHKTKKFEKELRIAGAQPAISMSNLKKYKIPLPPSKTEQTAITCALSDVDALISGLGKLITKKRLLKQGAMQELLTGKKRLVGFSEEWEIKKLSEILKVKHGKSQKEVEDISGNYPILGTGGLMGYANHFLYDKPSVLIGRKGTIDKPQLMNSPFWTVDTLFYTEISNDYLPQYIYYNFLLINWYSHNEASGVPSLNAKTIENIEIAIAPTKTEQIAIAKIISDMDNEIEALEKRRIKTLAIKQGMMQELLTGKTRLI